MEVMELAELRKAFMPSEHRYENPHREAMQLRYLWTFDERPSKSADAKKIKQLFDETNNLIAMNNFSKANRLISKGLLINPRHHWFYGLRGDILSQQDKLDQAIKNYEEARKMLKFDRNSATEKSYVRNLIRVYRKRGMKNYVEGRLMEAASDYEQVLVLKPYGTFVNEIQDRLLKTLRKMDKYDAFRCEWTCFMKNAETSRASVLLTQYAEYKIFRREMSSARLTLFKAIDLDPDNPQAPELLQEIYDIGHHLVAFSITWSVYGCHDKALMAIEKARDCDPYNPGYTLLKAILLRLSGRLLEAARWLESVDKGFHKLLEPSRDKQGSIMGNLSIEETRVQLVKQWYLIRYDIAVQFMIEERYGDALKILQSSKLRDQYAETLILIGDCMTKLGDTDGALEMYLKALTKSAELKTIVPKSRKYVHLLKRITDILNDKCESSVDDGRTKEAIGIANEVARILDNVKGANNNNDNNNAPILGQNLGEALMCKARAHFNAEEKSKTDASTSIAEGLKLNRGVEERGLYKSIFNDEKMEKIIDNYGTKRKLPKSRKLLMQYS